MKYQYFRSFVLSAVMSLCVWMLHAFAAAGMEPLQEKSFPGVVPPDLPVEWELGLTLDAFRNNGGGLSDGGTVMGLFDGALTKEIFGNHQFFLRFQAKGNTSGGQSDYSGELQAVSNIEASPTLSLYECWYEYSHESWGLRVLIGLHDLNTDFDVLEHAGVFMNSSFGIQPTTAQVAPSIYPATSLATRVAWDIQESLYAQAGVYDGVSGDPGDDNGTHVILNKDDGVLGIIEVGHQIHGVKKQHYRKIALGGWYHSQDIALGQAGMMSKRRGLYVLAETNLCEIRPGTMVGLFAQSSLTSPSYGQLSRYFGIGATISGVLLPMRDNIGLALGSVEPGAGESVGEPRKPSETIIELTYKCELTRKVSIQPDLQWIIHPTNVTGQASTWVSGLRIHIDF